MAHAVDRCIFSSPLLFFAEGGCSGYHRLIVAGPREFFPLPGTHKDDLIVYSVMYHPADEEFPTPWEDVFPIKKIERIEDAPAAFSELS